MKKKEKSKRQKPWLPEEGRDRIHQGGAHPDKTKYRREKNRAREEGNVRDNDPGVFLLILLFPRNFAILQTCQAIFKRK